jgi:hypothetical protein
MCSLSLGQVVQQLQKQLENQKDVLKQYEPRLKKKEKEAKELTKVQYGTKIRASDLIICVLGQDAFLEPENINNFIEIISIFSWCGYRIQCLLSPGSGIRNMFFYGSRFPDLECRIPTHIFVSLATIFG